MSSGSRKRWIADIREVEKPQPAMILGTALYWIAASINNIQAGR
ncbi:hypothetical protein ACLB1N_33020 [Escherichia coli]